MSLHKFMVFLYQKEYHLMNWKLTNLRTQVMKTIKRNTKKFCQIQTQKAKNLFSIRKAYGFHFARLFLTILPLYIPFVYVFIKVSKNFLVILADIVLFLSNKQQNNSK